MYHGNLYFQRYTPAALLPRAVFRQQHHRATDNTLVMAPTMPPLRCLPYDASVAIGLTHDEPNENSCAVSDNETVARMQSRYCNAEFTEAGLAFVRLPFDYIDSSN